MHISIKFCLDFFITSRSIHVVLIGFQYIFVSFRILVYFVALRNISFRFVSFVAFRFRFVAQYNPVSCVKLFLFCSFNDIFFMKTEIMNIRVPVKCETKQKRNEMKRNETEQNETKSNETKRNRSKRNDIFPKRNVTRKNEKFNMA